MAGGTRWALAATLVSLPALLPWWIWPLYAHANAQTAADAVAATVWYAAVLAPTLLGAAGLTWPALGKWLWGAALAVVVGAIVQFALSTAGNLAEWRWAYLVLPAVVCGLFAIAIRCATATRASGRGASP